MKIVIAVDTDKQTIVKKTGQAAYFAIYKDNKVIDYIENRHGKGNHSQKEENHKNMQSAEHTNEHKKDLIGLSGCDIILVQAVGESMKNALLSIGLKVKKVRKKDGLTADELVKNFLDDNI